MYKTTDEIFVRISRGGFIPYIGMCGPIPNPIKVSTEICLKLVNAGIEVHQYDPVTKRDVKLTRQNVFDDQKFTNKKDKESVARPLNPNEQPQKQVDIGDPIMFSGVQKQDVTDQVQKQTNGDNKQNVNNVGSNNNKKNKK